jgi:hypothetical protein
MHFEGKCLERVCTTACAHKHFGLTYSRYLPTTENIHLYYDIKKLTGRSNTNITAIV